MFKMSLLFGIFAQVIFAQVLPFSFEDPVFRFDYQFSSQAKGWLKYHPIPGTWSEGRRRCFAEGAVLASPLNEQLKTAIISFVMKQKNSTPTTIFTGVHATFSKGDYSSVEGVHLLRMPIVWGEGEPDNYENTESCLTMSTDKLGSMADVNCNNVLPYVCYKPYTHLTMTECGTTDPAYKLDARTGSCYKFHARGLVWSSAYLTCIAEGGHLVVINTPEEMNVVKELYGKYPDEVIFSSSKHTLAIGFHDWGESVSFLTIHGEPVEKDYLKWAPGEPNNLTSVRNLDAGEFCGSVFRSGNLNDVLCGIPVPFICEKKPTSLLEL